MDLARRRGTESIRPELRQRISGAKERPLELAAPVGSEVEWQEARRR